MAIVRVGRYRIEPSKIVVWILGTAFVLIWFFPLYWMFIMSIKPRDQIMVSSAEWIPREVTLENYRRVFQPTPGTEYSVGRWFVNSVVVSVSTTFFNVALAALAGYALARMNFPGSGVMFYMILAVLMIPFEMGMIPLFLGVTNSGLADTYAGIILPSMTSVFSAYLFRQTFLSFPRDLEDAAFIDGSNRFGIFARIALPLARPTIIAGTIIMFTGSWNMFLWPFLITYTSKMKTMTLAFAIYSPADGRMQNLDFGLPMAAVTLLALPTMILFLALQRYFISGIRTTGLKGAA